MKTFSIALMVSAIGLALAVAPAEAAKKGKQKKSAGVTYVNKHRTAAVAAPGFQGGVRAGPLYNGPDYLGDDPDPSIRAYLLKDMTRYQGSY
jgi:hypothetical protein